MFHLFFLFFSGLDETRSALLPQALALFKAVLDSVGTDEILDLVKGSPGWHTKNLATDLLKAGYTEKWTSVANFLVENTIITMAIQRKTKFSHQGSLDMLKGWTAFSLDPQLTSVWNELFPASISNLKPKPRISNNLLQHLLEHIFPLLMESVNKSKCANTSHVETPTMTKEEEQVIFHICGYIQRKLFRKFNKRQNNKAAVFYLHIVKEWVDLPNENCETVPDSVKAWVNSIDRGGLVHVNNDFYCFIKEVEHCLRPILSHNFEKYRHIELVTSIVSELKSMECVIEAWRELVGSDIDSNELSEGLMEEVLKCWVSICGCQRVKEYVFKQNEKMARMGTPAFRKTLDKI